jgi:short-subunit dehydrogenase
MAVTPNGCWNKERAMIKDWQDKTVVVTGAATGIGRALCEVMAARGAIVYVTALTLEECQPVVDAINAKSLVAHPAALDVNDGEAFQRLLVTVNEQHGSHDVLVNNAGILYVGEFFDMDEGFIERLIQTNITAVTLGCLHAYRIMKQQGRGEIINIASMGGFSPTPSMAVYAATKHAVLGLTNSLACEAKAFGVEVRAACFGLITTELFNKAEIKGGTADKVTGLLPVKALSSTDAASLLVKQIGTARGIFYIPFYSRLTWWLYRFAPALLKNNALNIMKDYRALVAKEK